ncbi:hypothetical protein BJV77DRAFT_943053, partial [Russula vinacea]
GNVRAERGVLKSASLMNSPGAAERIVRLHYSVAGQSPRRTIHGYMGGGDLLNLSFERYTYQEGSARFCVVEVYSPLARDETKQTRCALFPHRVKSEWVLHWAHDTSGRWAYLSSIGIILMQLRAYYKQQRLHLVRKHGADLNDNPRDGSRPDRRDLLAPIWWAAGAALGGDGESGILT